MHHSPRAVHAVRGAVRAALRAEMGLSTAWRYDSSLAEDDFMAAVTRHRVGEVLADAGDRLSFPAPIADRLGRAREHHRLGALVLTRELVRVHDLLGSAGIPYLSVKGPVLALITTGDVTARGIGDVDLFVHPDHVETAIRTLADVGWQQTDGFPRPGPSWAWRHFLANGYELPLHGAPVSIDLHWRLDRLTDGLPDFEQAWSRRTCQSVGGRSIPTLSAGDTLDHSLSHAARDDWRWLRSLVDVHRLVRRHGSPGRPRKVATRTLAVTAWAIGLPEGAEPPPGHAKAIAVAARSQEEPVPDPDQQRLPGLELMDNLSRLVRDGGRARGLGRAVGAELLPPWVLADISDEAARTAVPRAVATRLGGGPGKLRTWWRTRA